VEQFTVVCHVIIITVNFQTTFEDVLVCDLLLMALLTLFLSLSTEHVVFFVCYVSLQFFWTKCRSNLFVNNNNNNNNNNNKNILTLAWLIRPHRKATDKIVNCYFAAAVSIKQH